VSWEHAHRMRVLVVDDNQHMIHIVKTILSGFGIKLVREARDPAEAFDIVKSEPIDVIVVDFLMNILDGIDFIKLVRTGADSPNPYVPIVMLTAYSERSKVAAARDAGVNEFCCKPVTAHEMLRKFTSVIERPRPFVRTATYFGPDRRRRPDPDYARSERRQVSADAKPDPAKPASAKSGDAKAV
jgi:two-component system, chemotaxis family, chemotaxis protein CheY